MYLLKVLTMRAYHSTYIYIYIEIAAILVVFSDIYMKG